MVKVTSSVAWLQIWALSLTGLLTSDKLRSSPEFVYKIWIMMPMVCVGIRAEVMYVAERLALGEHSVQFGGRSNDRKRRNS